MKRKISAALAFTMALPTVLTTISGCVSASAEDKMSNGELIKMVISTFGFEGYQSTEPHISNVQKGNDYFDAVQTAYEYGVIDESVTELDVNALATREFCAMLLAGAIYDDKTDDIAIKDMADIKYLDDVKTVLNYGIMELDENGNFNPDDTLEMFDCGIFTDSAYQVWCTCTGDEPEYEIELQDNVIDFSGASYYSYDESAGSMIFDTEAYSAVVQTMSDSGFAINNSDNSITVKSAESIGAEVGSIIISPDNKPLKVTAIEQNADGTEKLVTVPASFEEVIENYSVEQNIAPDLTQATFYDVNGNIIEDEVSSDMSLGVEMLSTSTNIKQLSSLTKSTISKKVKIPGYGEVKLEIQPNSIAVNSELYLMESEKKGVSNTKTFKDDPFKVEAGLSLTHAYEFNNINFDYDAEFSLDKKKHFKFLLNYETVEKVGIKGEYKNSVKVCDVEIPTSIADVKINMEVSIAFTVEGTIELVITTGGRSNGVEWREGCGLTIIKKSNSPLTDVTGSIKATVTVPVKIFLSACFDFLSLGFEITPGVGAKLTINKNEIEEAKDVVKSLYCGDFTVYPILKVAAFAKLDISFEVFGQDISVFEKEFKAEEEIFGSSHTLVVKHLEAYDEPLPKVVPKCTLNERLKALSDAEMEAAGVAIGDKIILKESVIEVEVDESFDITLDTIPSGYTFDDLMIISYDREHVKLSESAIDTKLLGIYDKFPGISYTATAIKEGRTTLTVKTTDGKYSANCTVKITDPNAGTDYSIKLETYAVSAPVGTTDTIEITALPAVITEDDVLWSSDDTAVVIVDQYGKFTAREVGSAIITAATPDKKSIAACSVLVSSDPQGNLTINVTPVWVVQEKLV